MMIEFLLAGWLATQCWETETVCTIPPIPAECADAAPATAYRARWSYIPYQFSPENFVEVPAPPPGQTWVQYCFPDPTPDSLPNQPIYYVFVAVNPYGESDTEHGPIQEMP